MYNANWKPAYCACNGIPELWVCFCHNGNPFTGTCQKQAENKRAKYYNVELPHHPFYLNGV